MRTFRLFLAIFFVGYCLIAFNLKLFACGGTTVPPCGRTIWLAKFPPTVVLFPSTGTSILVPIGVLPFVSWDNINILVCPQPISASITLTLTCTPQGATGPTTVIGPIAFSVATPVTPGIQRLGAPLVATIPAGTFPTLTPQICRVVGTYTVNFNDNSSITATGDTRVCLIPPSKADPSLPELNMAYIKINNEDFKTCAKGDQTTIYYLIENNDPGRSVTLSVSATTNQVSKMPASNDPDDGSLFSLSDPDEGTDNFPIVFSENGSPGEMITLPEPFEKNNREIKKDITIHPMDVEIIAENIRSWGMCGNGSCSETVTVLSGSWSDGAPAIACAGTALLVDDVPPKSPLCEIEDMVKSSATADVNWSKAEFGTIQGLLVAASTFFNSQTTSQNLVNIPQQAEDSIRTDVAPTTVKFSVDGTANFQGKTPGQDVLMDVDVSGLGLDSPFSIPLVGFGNDPTSKISLAIDSTQDSLVINDLRQTEAQAVTLAQSIPGFKEGSQIALDRISGGFVGDPDVGCDCQHLHGSILIDDLGPFPDPDPTGCGFGCISTIMIAGGEVFNGSLSNFLEMLPNDNFSIDKDTCRTFTITCPPEPDLLPVIVTNPPDITRLLGEVNIQSLINVEVLNARNQHKISWDATVSAPGVKVDPDSGSAGTDLNIIFDPSQLASFPDTTSTLIKITNMDAINSPLFLPIAARTTITPTPVLTTLTVDPATATSALRFQTAVVTALDQFGAPMSGININTSTMGNRVIVIPTDGKTGSDGTAKFRFRFGLVTKDGVITFSANGLTATITQTATTLAPDLEAVSQFNFSPGSRNP